MSRPMNRELARQLIPGDRVYPIPLWNRSERRHMQVPSPAKVLAVRVEEGGSQTGVMVTVATVGGGGVCLDAAWFETELARDTGGGL